MSKLNKGSGQIRRVTGASRMPKKSFRLPNLKEQQILDRVEVILLGDAPLDRARYKELMSQQLYPFVST